MDLQNLRLSVNGFNLEQFVVNTLEMLMELRVETNIYKI